MNFKPYFPWKNLNIRMLSATILLGALRVNTHFLKLTTNLKKECINLQKTLKRESQLQQTIILIFFFCLKIQRKQVFGLSCESSADDSHEISRLIFSEKIIKTNLECHLLHNVAWRLTG